MFCKFWQLQGLLTLAQALLFCPPNNFTTATYYWITIIIQIIIYTNKQISIVMYQTCFYVQIWKGTNYLTNSGKSKLYSYFGLVWIILRTALLAGIYMNFYVNLLNHLTDSDKLQNTALPTQVSNCIISFFLTDFRGHHIRIQLNWYMRACTHTHTHTHTYFCKHNNINLQPQNSRLEQEAGTVGGFMNH
jgi:uncharacterized protein with NAD-binding domain and iron-sulfur cluster